MKRLLIVTNQPAPYRVDFFIYLQENYSDEYDIWVLFSSDNASTSRTWKANEEKLKNKVFLKSKVIKLKSSFDTNDKVISYGTGKRLDEIKPDVVVCSEYNWTSLAVKHWCNYNKIPFISWTDGTKFSERNIKLHQKLFRKYVIKNSAAFIASSSKSKENQIYLGADTNRIEISELAIDIRKYENAGRDYKPNNSLIAVGSLIERKGIDLLFDALSLIKDKNWKLKLIGNGDQREELKNKAQKLGIISKIDFCGYLSGDDLIRAYEKSGLFVFPTREDCFGLVTLEAMCCGLPCIVSKYAGSSYDLVEPGKNGMVIDPYDSQKFADVIDEFLDNDSLKSRMSKESKMKSYEFGFEKTAKPFMDAIRIGQK